MTEGPIAVYDQGGALLGVLENAGDVSYTLEHNDLWTASFTLPSGDGKNAICQAHNMVRIPDGTRDIGLYRIVGMPSSEETAEGGMKTYSLEHVMATLLDDVLFGYHEIGGAGVTTAQVIAYILSQQTTQRWALGQCDFDDQYAYKFENTTLLTALLSLGNVMTEAYTWDFDTSGTPWTVNLRRADATPGCGIHYMRNMAGIEKSMDATTLVTRLYLLGYGEGVNQLTIRDVNGGLPYIDADTAGTWGIKASVYADTRIEDAATLKARGEAVLAQYKNPYISYTASAIDLTRLTGQEWDKHMPGKLVRVTDGEHGVDITARIVSISKSDARGRPGEIEITIANAARDAADSINTLADRMGISELYSQGATNLYSQQYADNADASHPAKMRVYVPSGCVRINQMMLSWTLSPFRAYETGAAAGGANLTTTSTGGAATRTSSAGGGTSVTVSQKVAAVDILTSAPQSLAGGGTMTETGTGGPTTTGRAGSHTHSIAIHRHSVSDGASYTGYEGVTPSSNGSHDHDIEQHAHGMNHNHQVYGSITVPGQTIQIGSHSHSVDIPDHSHSVTLENHTHEIAYGIYEGGTAGKVTLRVDGSDVPEAAMQADEMEIVAYLAKDGDGKITRGTWREIEIVPDGLTRIEANLFVQAFVQSVGGGDY